MTNEQLAIIISGYALRLDELIKQLNDEIPEGAEQHLTWVRLDGSPAIGPLDAFSAALINAEATGKSAALKQVSTGDCVCLDGLRQFSGELRMQVYDLSASQGLAKAKGRARAK